MSTRYVWDESQAAVSAGFSLTDVRGHVIQAYGTTQIPSFTTYFCKAYTASIKNGVVWYEPDLTQNCQTATTDQKKAVNAKEYPYVIQSYRDRDTYYSYLFKNPDKDWWEGVYTPYWLYEAKYWGTNSGYTVQLSLYNGPPSNSDSSEFDCYMVKHSVDEGSKVGQKSSGNENSYPENGLSGEYYYTYLGSDTIDPLSVSYSTEKPERGEQVMVTVNPRANTLGGTISYLYQYSINGGSSWVGAGAETTDTEKGIAVPANAEQFMVRVRAADNLGFTSSDYVSGSNLAVQTMRLWVGVDNKARRGKKLWVGVDGKARRVVKAWVGVDGKARRFF